MSIYLPQTIWLIVPWTHPGVPITGVSCLPRTGPCHGSSWFASDRVGTLVTPVTYKTTNCRIYIVIIINSWVVPTRESMQTRDFKCRTVQCPSQVMIGDIGEILILTMCMYNCKYGKNTQFNVKISVLFGVHG